MYKNSHRNAKFVVNDVKQYHEKYSSFFFLQLQRKLSREENKINCIKRWKRKLHVTQSRFFFLRINYDLVCLSPRRAFLCVYWVGKNYQQPLQIFFINFCFNCISFKTIEQNWNEYRVSIILIVNNTRISIMTYKF